VCEIIYTTNMTPLFQRINCPLHKLVTICGYPPYVCNSCSEEGWVGRGGDGGPTHAINKKTKEHRYEREISSDDPF